MANKEMRAVYVETLIDLAKSDDRVMVVEADLMKATGTTPFKAAYPERFVNAGVAEANMVGIAAGLAAEGKRPFAATFGCFASRRAFDQFFVSCAYAQLPVRLVGTDPGVSAAFNGGTHMPFEDLGIMRTVPGLPIVEPSDPVSLAAYVRLLAAFDGPAYMRLHRKAIEPLYPEGEAFQLGKAKLLREGKDAVIVALGAVMVPAALKAAELLKAAGIEVGVIDALSLRPLDTELILAQARKTGIVVTAENAQAEGGLGSAVAELLAELPPSSVHPRLARIGVQGLFGEVGTQDYLQQRFGLTAEAIADRVKALAAERK